VIHLNIPPTRGKFGVTHISKISKSPRQKKREHFNPNLPDVLNRQIFPRRKEYKLKRFFQNVLKVRINLSEILRIATLFYLINYFFVLRLQMYKINL